MCVREGAGTRASVRARERMSVYVGRFNGRGREGDTMSIWGERERASERASENECICGEI